MVRSSLRRTVTSFNAATRAGTPPQRVSTMRISARRFSPSGRTSAISCSPGSVGRPNGLPTSSEALRPISSSAALLAKRTLPCESRMTIASELSCTSVICGSGFAATARLSRPSRILRRETARRIASVSVFSASRFAPTQSSAPASIAAVWTSGDSWPTATTGASGPSAMTRARNAISAGPPAPISTTSASSPGASSGSMPSARVEKLKRMSDGSACVEFSASRKDPLSLTT